jgi:hypothetical protein
MSYIINNSRGQVIAVVADGTINNSATSLALVGRGVNGYGESENENYVFLLENFASPSAPQNPIAGQLWFNTSSNTISVYNTSNTWDAVPTEAYVQAQKISPIFTGVPTAPTAPSGTANAQLATTAFVSNSPVFNGTPRAPTATAGTSSTQIATTEFVTNSVQLDGSPTATTADSADNSGRIATTAFVQNQKISPVFLGQPTAPTATAGTATTQIATTEFVTNSAQLAGTPTAPTATPGTATAQIATTAFVTNSPIFSGNPRAPTAANGTANTQIATTAFVANTFAGIGPIGTIAAQNANNVSITGGQITGITPLSIGSGGTGAAAAAQARTNLGIGTLGTQNSNNVEITGGNIQGVSPIAIFSGGTGASTAIAARINLGLDTMAQQNAGSVNISGGVITGIQDLSIADGGTGASTASDARVNLGIGTMGTQSSAGVSITGGSISGVSLTSLLTPLAITSGGTGAVSAPAARFNLGLGTMSQQDSSSVQITGGSITNISPLLISSGGTGADNAAQAMRNLLPNQAGNFGKVLATNGSTLEWITPGTGDGTVTQVVGNGYANGLYLTGNVTSVGALTLAGEIINISGTAIARDLVAPQFLGVNTPNSTTWLRGDSTWQTLSPLATTSIAPISNGGTGAITAQAAINNLLPSQASNSGKVLQTNGVNVSWQSLPTLGPLASLSLVPIVNGGTGAATATDAITNLLPSQTGNAARVLTTNGTVASWQPLPALPSLGPLATLTVAPIINGGTGATTASTAINNLLPSQTSASGRFLSTNGTNVTWVAVTANSILPSQSGQQGRFLYTNGSSVSWNNMPGFYTMVTSGNAIQTYSYTNIVGGFSNDANYFDVLPPAGKTMNNLVAFLPSIAYIYFAGGVDANDALRCIASYQSDRIRVYVQNTEQRYFPSANYLAFWS